MEASHLLTNVLEEGVRSRVFPGAVLLVRHEGRLLVHEAVGTLSTLPHAPPVHRHTLYDLASLTKPLATVSAILLLVQEGMLELETPLQAVLSETKHHPLGAIPIRDFLCHRSGLPDWQPLYQAFPPTPVPDRESIRQREASILDKILHEPLNQSLSRNSVYSDLGFMLLGFLVQRVTRTTLADFCHIRIYEPLGATPLGYRLGIEGQNAGEQHNIAPTEEGPWRTYLLQGEVHDDNAFALGGMAGHAGLFGTAEAVGQVTHAWLEGYKGNPGIFDGRLVKEFVTAQPGTSWALGWDTPTRPSSSGQWFSPESFGHLGFTGTSIWIDPIRELEVIFLSNRVHPTRDNPAIKAFRPKLHDLIIQERVMTS